MKKIIFTLICSTSLFLTNTKAQSERFKAGIFAGINLAQIDGDRQQGYDKMAPAFGLRGGMILTRRFDITTELMYNGRGAKRTDKDALNARVPSTNIQLQYADMMLASNWHYSLTEDGYYRSTLTLGLSYGRLLRASSEVFLNNKKDTVLTANIAQDKLKSADFGLMLGWSYRFTHKIGIQIRHTFSLNSMYYNPNYNVIISKRQTPIEYLRLQSYFLSGHVFYDFIAPKPKKKRTVKPKP